MSPRRLRRKSISKILFYAIFSAMIFIVSLLVLPLELFFVTTVFVLFGLHEIEKELSNLMGNSYHLFGRKV
jgi:hypothetical protein